MEDIRALQWAVNECRTQRDNHLAFAREAARKVRQLEEAMKTLYLAAGIKS